MTSLAEELPRQQARCRKMLEDVLEIGPAGAFLAMFLRRSLAKAEKAAAEGDVIAMLEACQELQEYKE
jgi:hypothetical protein